MKVDQLITIAVGSADTGCPLVPALLAKWLR